MIISHFCDKCGLPLEAVECKTCKFRAVLLAVIMATDDFWVKAYKAEDN